MWSYGTVMGHSAPAFIGLFVAFWKGFSQSNMEGLGKVFL